MYAFSRTFLAAALTAALSGCAVGPDYHRPDLAVPEHFTREAPQTTAASEGPGGEAQHFDSAAKLPQQWWTAFGSPEINALVERAFAHNPTVDAAKAALKQAHESTAAQFDAFFPVLQANYSASRQSNPVGTISPTLTSGDPIYTLHTAQLNVSYAPDVFGLNRRTVESLSAQEAAQRYQLQAVYTTLASNVVSTAIQLAALDEQITAVNEQIVANQKALDILHQQAKAGFASGLDVASQEAAFAQVQQALPPLQKQREQTRDMLAVLVGTAPSDTTVVNITLDGVHLPQALPLALPSELVKQRPDVRAAEEQVHAASAGVGIAIANRLPQFSITGNYGGTATEFSQMFKSGNRFWGLTGNLAETLFDFGALKHHQNAAEAALDQATAQYRGVVLGAFQNMADTLYALDADAKGLAASVNAERATKRSLDLTRRQLDLGAVNALALVTAEQAYQQARVARLQAQATRFADTVALYQALGGGWQTDKERAAGNS